MKTVLSLRLSGLVLLAIAGCKPETNTATDEARRQLEATQATYAQQAADMQSRSEDLQKQLAELQRSIQDKENAELKAKLDAISAENQKLMADAKAARRKSEQLREQLASNSVMPTQVPVAMPYVPPMVQSPVSQRWNDPDADYSMFYDSLNSYGRWLQVDGYGYAFRPNLSERSSWRPYVDGRWVSTNQGWAWDSREPFGWACYHYGRWVRLSRHGWVWIPGREWAPAWVSWRSGGSHVGWAPLPPTAGYGNISHDCDARCRVCGIDSCNRCRALPWVGDGSCCSETKRLRCLGDHHRRSRVALRVSKAHEPGVRIATALDARSLKAGVAVGARKVPALLARPTSSKARVVPAWVPSTRPCALVRVHARSEVCAGHPSLDWAG